MEANQNPITSKLPHSLTANMIKGHPYTGEKHFYVRVFTRYNDSMFCGGAAFNPFLVITLASCIGSLTGKHCRNEATFYVIFSIHMNYLCDILLV